MDDHWYLESLAADGALQRRTVGVLPYTVGRDPANHLALDAPGMSRRHALLDRDDDGRLRVVDLGSTNGTFVNLQRIGTPRTLRPNDVLHFGTAEFRVGRLRQSELAARAAALAQSPTLAAQDLALAPSQVQAFDDLLAGVGLSAAVQPIINGLDGRLFAWELLGRAKHPDLPGAPVQLFQLAGRLGKEAQLSEAFRRFGVRTMAPHLRGARLFMNTHPKEAFTAGFVLSMRRLREQAGSTPRLVVELPERAVTDTTRMRELSAQLRAVDIGVAYDEWGTMNPRREDLAAAPAQYIKFDMSLVRDIHRAPPPQQRHVRDLVRTVLDSGAVPLAEGVEFRDDAEVCRDMGFALLQGFHTGRPVPVAELAAA